MQPLRALTSPAVVDISALSLVLDRDRYFQAATLGVWARSDRHLQACGDWHVEVGDLRPIQSQGVTVRLQLNIARKDTTPAHSATADIKQLSRRALRSE